MSETKAGLYLVSQYTCTLKDGYMDISDIYMNMIHMYMNIQTKLSLSAIMHNAYQYTPCAISAKSLFASTKTLAKYHNNMYYRTRTIIATVFEAYYQRSVQYCNGCSTHTYG